jgi:hypothetical protein
MLQIILPLLVCSTSARICCEIMHTTARSFPVPSASTSASRRQPCLRCCKLYTSAAVLHCQDLQRLPAMAGRSCMYPVIAPSFPHPTPSA